MVAGGTTGGVDGIVDAHVHLWDTGAMRISWFRDDLGLPARVGPEHLAAALATSPVPVRAAVAVQAADTEGEARWLARQAAARAPLPGPVVLQYDARTDDPAAWAGMAQPVVDAARATRSVSTAPAAGPGASPAPTSGDGAPLARPVAGIRLAVPGGAADLSDVAGLDALCEGLAATGRVLETLVRPEQLPAVAAVAGRHPRLDVVVCHLGLGTRAPDGPWREALRHLAARPRAHAKLSGIHTAAPDDAARVATVARAAVDLLGPDRLLFGSDWPMSARVAPYAEVVERTARALPRLGDAATRAVWGATAARLYGVDG